jgi:hypothetical protein
MLVTAAAVIPRSLSIAHSHSESWDDQYHLLRGLAQWRGNELRIEYNDPPLGEMILATPLWMTGCSIEATQRDPSVIAHNADPMQCILYGQPRSAETLLMLVSAWKAILFLPGTAVIFLWCRKLYGLHAACLALAAIIAEPTIGAHTSVAALDVLAMEAIVICCYLQWRYFDSPSAPRLIGVCAAIAAALAIKLTTIIVLPTCIVFAILHRKTWTRASRRGAIAAAILLVPLFIWAFTFFDFSKPNEHCGVMSTTYTEHWSFGADVVNANAARSWPAGIYIASLVNGLTHSSSGHLSYLLGESKRGGWWYYQFVAAAVKMPVGMMVFLAVGLVTLLVRRARFDEWSLIVPFLFALISVVASNVSIGFRHSIPWYVFAMMLASRCAQNPSRAWIVAIAWCGVIVTAIHGAMWHPDELSYTNGLWRNPQEMISDSNIDWGQGLKEIRQWLDTHPHQGRPIHAQVFIPDTAGVGFDNYLSGEVKWVADGPPNHGLLLLSPVMIWGGYVPQERFAKMRDREPMAIIGHCIRVYDLDEQEQGH